MPKPTTPMSARDVRTLVDELNAEDPQRRCSAVGWLASLVSDCPDALVYALGYEPIDDDLSEEYLSREDWQQWRQVVGLVAPRNRWERRHHGSL